jgi:hypothetical protein
VWGGGGDRRGGGTFIMANAITESHQPIGVSVVAGVGSEGLLVPQSSTCSHQPVSRWAAAAAAEFVPRAFICMALIDHSD